MCSCLGAREKESPSHMHFGHCWTLFGVWCSVALFGSVVPEGRRSCAVVLRWPSTGRSCPGRGTGISSGLVSHASTSHGRTYMHLTCPCPSPAKVSKVITTHRHRCRGLQFYCLHRMPHRNEEENNGHVVSRDCIPSNTT